MELLRKHEALSPLHRENLAKAKAHKDVLAAQYRELEQERKERADAEEKDRKRQRVAASSAVPAAPSSGVAAPSLEAGIGGKMLKMMGWKSGEGLGKHGTGITTPVAAVGNVGSDTAGIGAKPVASSAVPPIDMSDMASYKERLQQMARARYDAAPRGL